MTYFLRDASLSDRFLLHAIGEDALAMFGDHECAVNIPEYQFDESDIHRIRVAVGATGRQVGYALTERHDGDLYLRSMFVHSSHNHRGVGSLLLDDVLEFARENGLQSVSLLTSRDSPWSVPFYTKFGFEIPEEALLPPHISETMHAASEWASIRSIPGYLPLVGMSRHL